MVNLVGMNVNAKEKTGNDGRELIEGTEHRAEGTQKRTTDGRGNGLLTLARWA